MSQQNVQSFHLKRGGTVRIKYAEMLWNVNSAHTGIACCLDRTFFARMVSKMACHNVFDVTVTSEFYSANTTPQP